MFNDERINFEMTKLKKIIIVLSGILSLLFLTFKLFVHQVRELQFCLYSTEILIVLCSVCIMMGSLFIKSDVKDEMFILRKQKYYNIAFKVLLYISFIGYALVIPATIVSGDNSALSSNMCINMIMMSSLFFGYGFLRLKKVYFNFNFIEEENKVYYKNVFKNIWKITKFFLIIYLIAFFISIFYMFKYNPISFIVAILFAFVATVLSNSIYYFFISFLERLFYEEENKKIVKTPTVILSSITILCLVVYVILNISYYIIINNGITSTNASQISYFANMIKSTTEYLRFFSVLTIIFLVTDLFSNDKSKIKSNLKLVMAFIIFIAYEIFWSRIQGGLNVAIIEMSQNIGNIDSFDLYAKITRFIQTYNLLIKSSFYVILSLLILIINNKKLRGKIGLILIFIFWIILYTIIPITYFFQKEDLMIIGSYLCVGILSIIIISYLLINYFKKTNKILNEE